VVDEATVALWVLCGIGVALIVLQVRSARARSRQHADVAGLLAGVQEEVQRPAAAAPANDRGPQG
jgi:hypothetical protein